MNAAPLGATSGTPRKAVLLPGSSPGVLLEQPQYERHRLAWWEKALQLGLLRVLFRSRPAQAPTPMVSALQSDPRLFILRNDRLGDAILTTGVLDWLHRERPTWRVTLWMRPGPADLLATHPAVERIIPYRGGILHLASALQTIRRLRFPVAVNLSTRAHGIHNQALLGLAGIPYRVGFQSTTTRTTYSLGVPRPRDRHMVRVLAAVFAALGLDATTASGAVLRPRVRVSAEDLAMAAPLRASLQGVGPVIGLNRFARLASRSYGLENTFELAQQIARTWPAGRVVLLAPPDEWENLARARQREVDAGRLAGERVLMAPRDRHPREMAAVGQCLDAVVTPDTAWVHLAAALEKPVVNLVPDDDEHRWTWAPFGVPSREVVVQAGDPFADVAPACILTALRELVAP